MNTNDLQPNTSLIPMNERILARIATEQITPYRRLSFRLREGGIWCLWLATVVIGALAVAVSMYVGINAEYALYEATHENFFTFVVEVLPYLWVLLLGSMTYLAIKELRQTKRGYRYSTVQILGSSLVLSLLGGMVFQYAGFGYVLDQILGRQIAMYMSMEKMDMKMWQSPEQGRLVGMLIPRPERIGRDTVLQFEDIAGVRWSVNDGELNEREIGLLMTKDRVRLLGTSTAPGVFHICGIFPWMFERSMARSEMMEERSLFDNRMSAHKMMLDSERISHDNTVSGTPPAIPVDHICAHLEMMERI